MNEQNELFDDNPHSLKLIGMILHILLAFYYILYSFFCNQPTNTSNVMYSNRLPVDSNTSPTYTKYKIFENQ